MRYWGKKTMMKTFNELLAARKNPEVPNKLLAIDPGETVGWALFEQAELSGTGEVRIDIDSSGSMNILPLHRIIKVLNPDLVVIEDYRVYAHKANAHTWNALYTPKLIGALQYMCQLWNIPYVMQMASSKQFCTDSKLKIWGYYKKASKHSMDAVRHGCYYLLFHK